MHDNAEKVLNSYFALPLCNSDDSHSVYSDTRYGDIRRMVTDVKKQIKTGKKMTYNTFRMFASDVFTPPRKYYEILHFSDNETYRNPIKFPIRECFFFFFFFIRNTLVIRFDRRKPCCTMIEPISLHISRK